MNFVILLALLPFVASQGNSIGNFTIITSNTIRCGKPFNVVARGFGLTGTIKFTLRIFGNADSGSVLSMKRSMKISDQKPRSMVQIDTSKIPKGSYNFSVSTTNYSESKALTYKTNEYTFLIQTDKAIYFPRDLIRFRVLAINSETKSVNPKRLPFISIRDAKGSVVFNVSDTGFVKGKYQGELQLTDTPSFGFWHIEAQSGNDTGGRFIEVADIVFPAVHSELTVQPKVPISDGVVPIIITIKGSFTGIVLGIATLTIKQSGVQVYRKEININETKKVVDIDLGLDLNYSSEDVISYDVYLEYDDLLTNTTATDDAVFEVLPKTFNIKLNGDPYIKPGSDLTFSVVVLKYDGSFPSAGTMVDIKIENLDEAQTLELNDYGSASSTISVPLDARFILIKAISDDSTEAVLNLTLPLPLTGYEHGKKRATMRLDVVTKIPAVAEEVIVEVTLTEQIETVYCIITAKGLLLQTIEVPINLDPNQAFQTATFSFIPTFAYAPIASIVGYYVKADGKIVASSTSVELTGDLRNNVGYSFDVIELITGEGYEFNVTSHLNSTVSMFAYDQRLISLRDAVTITKNEVFSSLLSFYAPTPSSSIGRISDYELQFKFYGLNVFTSFKPHHSSYHYRKRSLLAELNESSKLNQTTTLQIGGSRQIKSLKPYCGSIFWNNYDIRQPLGDDESRQKGFKSISGHAGSNLTTFVVYSVSMSAYNGLGLPILNPTFGISMPFYLAADVPFSIKVSQVLNQGITLWQSYTLKKHSFNVTISKSRSFVTDYDGVKSSKTWIDTGSSYSRIVEVEPEKQNRIQFSLTAVKVGYIILTISAKSPTAADTITRVIRVTPYGVHKVTTDSKRIKFTDTKLNSIHNLTCQFPKTFLESHSANFTVEGDIMSRTFANLPTGLINMPNGCGEQVLIYLVPDVVVWIYLMETNQMTTQLQSTLQNYISVGYQRELSYARWDGGFAAFGNNDRHSSTWLTAYAGWAFYLAHESKSIYVDPNVLRRGLDYIQSQQRSDGSFQELQPVYHTELLGGVDFDITLTAYVSIYLTTVIESFPEYKSMHERAIKYLEMNWYSRTDVFGLAIITYALSLNGSPKAGNIMNFFFANRYEDRILKEISYETFETTAYCLLILLARGERLDEAEKIANYLVRKSNEFGGYSNTQNTVMGVYALSRYALFTKNDQGTGQTNLTIISNSEDKIQQTFDLSNIKDRFTVKLNQNATSVQISSSSKRTGVFIASLSCGYYDGNATYKQPFNITFGGTYVCQDYFILKLSINYNKVSESTGMTVATITFPSGFTFKEVPNRNELEIKEPKILEDGHKVQLYFDSLTNTPISFRVTAIRSSAVDGRLEGYINVVDNYYPDNQASASFALPEVNLNYCDLVSRRR